MSASGHNPQKVMVFVIFRKWRGGNLRLVSFVIEDYKVSNISLSTFLLLNLWRRRNQLLVADCGFAIG